MTRQHINAFLGLLCCALRIGGRPTGPSKITHLAAGRDGPLSVFEKNRLKINSIAKQKRTAQFEDARQGVSTSPNSELCLTANSEGVMVSSRRGLTHDQFRNLVAVLLEELNTSTLVPMLRNAQGATEQPHNGLPFTYPVTHTLKLRSCSPCRTCKK